MLIASATEGFRFRRCSFTALAGRVSRPGKSWLANEKARHVAAIRAPRMIGTYVEISMVINEVLANLAEERKRKNVAGKWPAINFLYERLRKILLREMFMQGTQERAPGNKRCAFHPVVPSFRMVAPYRYLLYSAYRSPAMKASPYPFSRRVKFDDETIRSEMKKKKTEKEKERKQRRTKLEI